MIRQTHDPYQPPVAPVGDGNPVRAPISLKRSLLRVLGWTVVLFLVVNGIAMASGFLFGSYVASLDAPTGRTIADLGLLRRIAIGVVCFAVYLTFLQRTPAGRVANAFALVLSYEVFDRLIALLLFGSAIELNLVVLARHLGVALLALAIVTALAAHRRRTSPRATL